MAAVAEHRPDPTAQFGSRVDDQIAQASSRIRVHDLTLGVLTLAALVAIYATAMILLDKYLNIPEWVRQLALAGFGACCAVVGYFLLARPLLKPINPLYAAARVEETVEDAKNSITGYVEAQEEGSAHPAVKAAMSARAARAAGEADVNEAIDNRPLIVAGGVLVVFLLALGVMFFMFRPTQFNSLASRAFLPFSSPPIATRTQLTLVKPEQPEPTITTGQTITVAVHVGGKIPAKTASDRVRVLLRHNPLDPNFEVIPMAEGQTTRDWEVKIPEYLVQHGFWYKVAAGDAETPEYKVTVRSLPLFTDFVAHYEYPAYTRKPNDKATDPNLSGVRGTKVTLVARTNRQVQAGLMRFDAQGLRPVAGKPVPGKPDSLAFQFTITEPTRYRLSMTTTDDEQSADAPPYQVSVDSDQPPRVEITKPEDEEKPEPANGLLAVDGTVGDDFGIDKVRLRMRLAGRDIKPVFYNGGKSLRRESDGSWPTDLSQSGGFKLSADLTKLEYEDGAPCRPKEGDVIEYWVEALDNCTETKPVEGWGDKPQPGNVGSSNPVRKLPLSAPRTAEAEMKQLDQEKQERGKEEQKHNAAQQQQLNNEQREPPKADPARQQERGKPQDKDADGKADSKTGDGTPQDGTPQEGKNGKGDKSDAKDNKDAKNGKGGMEGKEPAPPPKPMGGKQEDKTGKDGKTDPQGGAGTSGAKQDPQTKTGTPPKTGDMNGMGGTAGMTDPKAKEKEPKAPPAGSKQPDNQGGKSGAPPEKGGSADPNMGTGGGMSTPRPETAPPPKSEDDKKLDEQLRQAQEELNKMRGEGGDAKPNRSPKPEERAEPAKTKPQPAQSGAQDSQPKDGPKPDPMTATSGDKNAPGTSKPQGDLKPPPSPDPESKPGTPGQMEGSDKHEPLGGNAGYDKPPFGDSKKEGKKDTKSADPQDKKRDPASGSEARPATQRPDDGDANNKNPADRAGEAKPKMDNNRGADRAPQPPKGMPPADTQPKADPDAATAKPERGPPEATSKPAPKDGANAKQPDASETKEPPKEPMDPKNPAGRPAEARPEPPKTPMGGMGDEQAVQPGRDKMQPDPGQGGGEPKQDEKQPGKGNNAGTPKLDPKQLDELKDAAKDLNSPDQAKRDAARQKIDKTLGEGASKAIEEFQNKQKQDFEQLAKDLQSKDDETRRAAEKKVKELEQKLPKNGDALAKKDTPEKGKAGKGQERKLSEAELDKLVEQARDLTSGDNQKRAEAEKALDEQMGKEAREQLQEEMEKRKKELDDTLKDPEQREALKKKIEEQVKKDRKNSKGDSSQLATTGGGEDSSTAKSATENDPRNRLKAAQLQLENFKREQYGVVPDRLNWTPDEYDGFLKNLENRVRRLEKEAEAHEEALRNAPAKPTIAIGGAEKVGERENVVSTPGLKGGAGLAPPGFAEPVDKFRKAAQKIGQNK
jgi:hypothetical protein